MAFYGRYLNIPPAGAIFQFSLVFLHDTGRNALHSMWCAEYWGKSTEFPHHLETGLVFSIAMSDAGNPKCSHTIAEAWLVKAGDNYSPRTLPRIKHPSSTAKFLEKHLKHSHLHCAIVLLEHNFASFGEDVFCFQRAEAEVAA